jgi:hypothetical protein
MHVALGEDSSHVLPDQRIAVVVQLRGDSRVALAESDDLACGVVVEVVGQVTVVPPKFVSERIGCYCNLLENTLWVIVTLPYEGSSSHARM